MKLEQAIQQAMEGGWKPASYRSVFELNPNNKAGVHPTTRASYTHLEILLDHFFWQSLGKAMGWEMTKEVRYYSARVGGSDEGDLEEIGELSEWEYHWHRFIDHLADGGTPEDFFNQLTK